MDTEGGGEADTSQSESRHKEGHRTNIYLRDSDEAIVHLTPKGHATANSHSPSLARLQKK